MKNDKKPQVRFKGFNDDWEQRKVSETAEIAAGGTPSTSVSEYWEPKEVPWLSSGEVHKKYVTYTDDMISKLGLSNSSAKMIKENSILIALAGQGKTRGTVAINRISLSTNQSIAAMTFNDDIIPEFVFSNLENRYDEIRAMSSGDGSRGGLNKQLVGNIVIPYTIIEEQRKIGAYFENLDNLITLHQRKCDKLQKIKKSMLEKMFPQSGMKKPEIRFKGFNDDWEQRKLSDVADVRDGTHASPKYISEGHPLVTSKNVKDGFVNYDDIQYISDEDFDEINKRSKVDVNDVLIGMIGTIGNIALIRKEPDFAIKNVALIKDAKKINYLYIYHFLQSNSTIKQLTNSMDGGTQKFIALGNIRNLDIDIPSDQEQAKLGQYFESLDNLITLHQRKLEKLKYIKKSMLENMFV